MGKKCKLVCPITQQATTIRYRLRINDDGSKEKFESVNMELSLKTSRIGSHTYYKSSSPNQRHNQSTCQTKNLDRTVGIFYRRTT
eukprot:UN05456